MKADWAVSRVRLSPRARPLTPEKKSGRVRKVWAKSFARSFGARRAVSTYPKIGMGIFKVFYACTFVRHFWELLKRFFRFGAVCAPIWAQFDVIVALRGNARAPLARTGKFGHFCSDHGAKVSENCTVCSSLRAPRSPDFALKSPTQNCSWVSTKLAPPHSHPNLGLKHCRVVGEGGGPELAASAL